ncbi:hypothetical protein BTO32_15280 [Marinobacter lutaoensis]|uniref:Uncharacterized protein n=1 Tax=Marinobacter lutaoensis TaxID=135739 RepID=A0A1V2DPG7_9GAMM|nr:hypothetical protein [Marinobacter lutaoensis]ONF42568.1 hypothetical protein BTO32_15280 [Marinobacter lutaoensis]
MGENTVVNAIEAFAGTFIGIFQSLALEFGIINQFVIFFIQIMGFVISITGIMHLIKMKKPEYSQKYTAESAVKRLAVGPITILIEGLMLDFSESVFGDNYSTNAIPKAMTYSAQIQSGGDPMAGLLLAIVAFLVLVGWIAAGRAMAAFARSSDPGQDGYALTKSGFSRLFAAIILCSFQHVMDDLLESATGTKGAFSSQLNL